MNDLKMNNITAHKLPLFTDLGRALIDDTKGQLHDQWLEQIDGKIATIKKTISVGLPAKEKSRTEKELAALSAARRIVNLFWNSVHHKNN